MDIIANKRKAETCLDLPVQFKKKKTNKVKWEDWIYVKDTRNYLLNDPFLDFVRLYPCQFIKKSESYKKLIEEQSHENKFLTYTSSATNKFKNDIYVYLREKYGSQSVCDVSRTSDPQDKDNFISTVNAIKNSKPIILCGVLWDYSSECYGLADLIVRSDWVNKLCGKPVMSEYEINVTAPKLGEKCHFHYRIITVSNTTLKFLSNGINLSDTCYFPVYKGELFLLNKALSNIQGYDPQKSYMMGSRWKQGKNKYGESCFDRLGVVDFIKHDKKYAKICMDAIYWLRDLKKNGQFWEINKHPFPRKELYPNMNNKMDIPYTKIKRKIATDFNDITLLWHCGLNERNRAHKKGIYTWNDERLTSDIMGFKKGKRKIIIDSILNHRNSSDIVKPRIIKNNNGNWQYKQKLELYVDFETTCNSISPVINLNKNSDRPFIFMIGVGYADPETQIWKYKHFVVEQLHASNEYNICHQFAKFVTNLKRKYQTDPLLIHWGLAEQTSWIKAFCNNFSKSKKWPDFYWFNLLNLFHNEPITVKNCLTFGLKDIATHLHKHGLIQSIWDTTSNCIDGLGAATGAYEASQKKTTKFTETKTIQDIKKYNEVDCKVLYEIITYLRNNHIN